MRQFIIDDKGIVCIGTFGLRGSSNDDNAAAAVEACNNIILSLQALQIDAYIGVTSGKAYCGLVGSLTRHEYAVMGPNVNLSARLMARATSDSSYPILCDHEIQNRDRVHPYDNLGTIQAKGYSQPVLIYTPKIDSYHDNKRRRSYSNTVRKSIAKVASIGSAIDQANGPIAEADSIQNIDSLVGMSNGTVIHGRVNETGSVLKYLVRKVCLIERSSNHKSVLKAIHTDRSSIVVCIKGTQGIGKSCLLHNICNVISNVQYRKQPINAIILHKQLSSMMASESFYIWKLIFPELIIALVSRILHPKGDRICDVRACLMYIGKLNAVEYGKHSELFPLVGMHNCSTETSENVHISYGSQNNGRTMEFIAYLAATLQKLVQSSGMVPILAL